MQLKIVNLLIIFLMSTFSSKLLLAMDEPAQNAKINEGISVEISKSLSELLGKDDENKLLIWAYKLDGYKKNDVVILINETGKMEEFIMPSSRYTSEVKKGLINSKNDRLKLCLSADHSECIKAHQYVWFLVEFISNHGMINQEYLFRVKYLNRIWSISLKLIDKNYYQMKYERCSF